jgi:Dynamin family
MNSLTPVHRKASTRHLLEKLGPALRSLQEVPLQGAYQGNQLSGIVREIDRAQRQFDSKLFFVVIFGPVKAGKSTLTNALAGDYVSPTGFGKETTRRPSFVIKSTETGIDQYYPNNSAISNALAQASAPSGPTTPLSAEDADAVHAAFNQVADYIRGVRTEGELKQSVRRQSIPLTPENLEKALTENLQQEPLITVIRCRGGLFLDEGVALVDMPGLDGSRSNWRDNPIHEWVAQRAEFFLFAQSSVAALNGETQAFLKHLVAQETKPPIWQLQNIFDACHWQPAERRIADAETQRTEGRARICGLLNMNPRSSTGLNLGLAWDGKRENNAEWLKRSKFEEFESELAQVLSAERAQIQEHNTLRYLKKQIHNANDVVDEIGKEIADARSRHTTRKQELELLRHQVEAIAYRSDWEDTMTDEIGSLKDIVHQPWRDDLKRRFDRLRDELGRNLAGDIINQKVTEVAAEIARHSHYDKQRALPELIKKTDKYTKSAEASLLGAQPNATPAPVPAPPLTRDQLPDLHLVNLMDEDCRIQEKHWLVLKKKHNGGETKDHLNLVECRWLEAVNNAIETWAKDTVRNYFDSYCESRRRHYLQHFDTARSALDEQFKPTEASFAATESFAERVRHADGDLRTPLTNALDETRLTT